MSEAGLPAALSLYRAATRLARPLAPLLLRARARRGKEDASRLNERLGAPQAQRPEGLLVWLHAASVGESQVTLALGQALLKRRGDLTLLFTSGTTTSADMIARRKPDGAIHQYPPVDSPSAAAAFAAHWSPDLAVFAESELWPNLILETARTGAPMALVNARMNARSLRFWRGRRASAAWLLNAFDWIGAADLRTAEGLSDLRGAPVAMMGNLKLDAGAAAPDAALVETFRTGVTDRPAVVAASTHAGEEAVLIEALTRLRDGRPNALMLLAPRHPDRAGEVRGLIEAAGLSSASRAAGQAPSPNDAIWLIDTLGELSAAYAAAPAAFIAGSLKPGIGGHNPIEATRAGAAVITGPHVESFADVYAAYREAAAVTIAADADEIAAAVSSAWNGRGPDAAAGAAALATLTGEGVEAVAERLLALTASQPEPPSHPDPEEAI